MDGTESHPIPILHNALAPLYVVSGVSNLNKALESLIEVAKSPEGRLHLASSGILPPILQLCRHTSQLSPRDLFLSLKLLRNLCAGEIINQNSFIDQNGVKILSTLVTSDDDELLSMVFQVLGNVTLACDSHRVVVWREFFPRRFLDIAKIRRKETCDPLCMVICVCTEGSNKRSLDLCADAGQSIIVELLRTVTEAGYRQDWLKLLLSTICIRESCFPSIFSKLSGVAADTLNSDDLAIEINHFGPETEFLLNILSEILNEQVGDIVVSIEFSFCIFAIFKSVFRLVDFSTRGNSPTIGVMRCALSILRDISACDEEVAKHGEEEDIVDKLVEAGLVKFLISILRDLEPPSTVMKAMRNSNNGIEAASCYYHYCPYKGFRRDLVAVIGNCSYRRKRVQDEVREQGGILLLLQQCAIDEDNPFLREWGILAVRNILEGNEENQKRVADLELQKSVDSPEISRLGLRVEVDPRTGRPKLVNAS